MIHHPSRREAVAGLAALIASPAFAKAPLLKTQAAAFYRLPLGSLEITVISDGPLIMDEKTTENVFIGVPFAEVKTTLEANFLPLKLAMQQNALVINTGDRLVLIDTGMGSSKAMGETAGKLLGNLRAAGIDPASIDDVIISHAHADHCWGLVNDKGERNFPSAQVHISQTDLDIWTDETKVPEMFRPFVAPTKAALLPNRDRMKFIKDGAEVVPGIQAMATPGHTAGHMSFVVTSGSETLFVLADVAHHPVLSLQYPRASLMFDSDGAQAAATRLRIFDLLAAQRLPVIAYHFDWPGIGHIAKTADAYRYVTAPLHASP